MKLIALNIFSQLTNRHLKNLIGRLMAEYESNFISTLQIHKPANSLATSGIELLRSEKLEILITLCVSRVDSPTRTLTNHQPLSQTGVEC
jgi:hypothetical protein